MAQHIAHLYKLPSLGFASRRWHKIASKAKGSGTYADYKASVAGYHGTIAKGFNVIGSKLSQESKAGKVARSLGSYFDSKSRKADKAAQVFGNLKPVAVSRDPFRGVMFSTLSSVTLS